VDVHRTELAGAAYLMIRPEQIVIHADKRASEVLAQVEHCTYYGHDGLVSLRLRGSDTVVQARCAGHVLPHAGDEVALTVLGAAVAYPVPRAS
ncbi:MAG: TOBE domain-containing protein, partial [Sciscionella sp.]